MIPLVASVNRGIVLSSDTCEEGDRMRSTEFDAHPMGWMIEG